MLCRKKRPSASVTVAVRTAWFVCSKLTFAPLTIAPAGSLTVPLILFSVSWPKPTSGARHAKTLHVTAVTILRTSALIQSHFLSRG